MRLYGSLILANLVTLSACQLPPLANVSSDPTCPRDSQVGQTDIFVLSARGFRCHSPVAYLGPYRQVQGLNYGRSATGVHADHGLSPTLLVDEEAWDRDLDDRIRRNGAPVIYIHGFNNSEDQAVRTARAIRSLLLDSRPVVAVTWPSYAMLAAVGWDEANNEWAREALSARIAQIISRHKGTTLIAHSMGNRILLDLLISHPEAVRNIGQIVAAAPDVDEDQFMRHMQMGHSFGTPITIYASTKDQALAGSWRLHGMRRAGDLSNTAHSHNLSIRYHDLDPSVEIVDLSHVKGDPFGHSDFIQSVSGAADLCRVLNHLPLLGRSSLQGQYFQLAEDDRNRDDCDTRSKQAALIDKGEEVTRSTPLP